MEFDISPKSPTFRKANELSEDEQSSFEIDFIRFCPNGEVESKLKDRETFLNPFEMENKVYVTNPPDRFQYAVGNKLQEGKISEVISRNYVNVIFWDMTPAVVKNLHINSLSISKNNTLLIKLKFYSKLMFRKLFRIK